MLDFALRFRGLPTLLLLLCVSWLRAAVDPLADSTTGSANYPYRLYTPDTASSQNPLPLIVFLHGLGERGTNNQTQVQRHIQPLLNTTQEEANYKAYVVAPQSPTGWWNGNLVVGMVQHLITNHHIDPKRIYVTGLSAGGQGTWRSLAAGGEVFAAGVPLSGVVDVNSAAAIGSRGTPVWAFHGDADTVVSPNDSRYMIQLISAAGGKPRYTERSGWGHSNWSNIYSENSGWTDSYTGGDPEDTRLELYDWLFAQELRPAPAAALLAPGEGLLVDFGASATTSSPDSNGLHWNNANGSASTPGMIFTQMNTTNGDRTQTRMELLNAFQGANTQGVVDQSLYPQNAQSDTWWEGSHDGHAQALQEEAEIQVQGLHPNGRYRVRFFASRQGADGTNSRMTRYKIATQHRDLDATENRNQRVEFAEVAADEQGRFSFTVGVSPDSNSRFAYLGVMELYCLSEGPGRYSHYVYEKQLSGADAAYSGDGDGDGNGAYLEFLTGRDPSLADQHTLMQLPRNEATPGILIPLADELQEGRLSLERCSNLSSAQWTEVAYWDFADASSQGWTLETEQGRRQLRYEPSLNEAEGQYFRLVATPPSAEE